MRLLLVSSSGGHLGQLHVLRDWWGQHETTWVTFEDDHAKTLLHDQQVVWAYHPTTRNIPNLVRNFWLALRILRKQRPDVVVSTGAGVALPFFLVAKLLRIPTAYLEVYDRVDSKTLTGRLCGPLSDIFMLQWEEQKQLYPRGVVVGTVY